MRVALSIPVEHDGATFEVLMPDAVMARLLPAALDLLMSLPAEAQAALAAGGTPEDTEGKQRLGLALLQPDLLALFAEAFDAGVVAWDGVAAEDGSPLACGPKCKAYIPITDKLSIVLAFIGRQQVLAAKKEPAT